MPDRRVRRLTTDADWDAAVPILRQRWTDAEESFVRSWREEDGYTLFGLEADDELVAVAGVSVQRVLHHARHAWIHDFVVAETHRGAGHGSAHLDAVEAWALERDCESLALAARAGNDDARAFYRAEGLRTWGHVMERPLSSE